MRLLIESGWVVWIDGTHKLIRDGFRWHPTVYITAIKAARRDFSRIKCGGSMAPLICKYTYSKILT